MSKSILLVGEPYAGKTTFAKELVRKYGYRHYSIGELVRARYEDGRFVDIDELREIIEPLDLGHDHIIIDNPLKVADQAAILEMFHPDVFDVWFLERAVDLDMSARGRPDDVSLNEKIKHFRREFPAIESILRSRYECKTFVNSADGFVERLI